MRKMNSFFLLMLLAVCSLSCTKDDVDADTDVPDPGVNVAGAVAGTYKVSGVLSGPAGSSSQGTGAMTGSGTVTLVAIDNNTVTYRNQTELTVTATGEKILLNEDKSKCRVEYDKVYKQIAISEPVGSIAYGVARMVLKNRINVARSNQKGYDVTVEFSR